MTRPPASNPAHACSRATPRGDHVLYAGAAFFAALAAWSAGGGPVALIGVAAFALHLAWQARQAGNAEPMLALRLFRSNRDAGLILACGLAADALAKALF